ncbi:MAG TPA: TetR family transcriptional regulator C-terminal domain-containing protein, partial [Rhizomicrobium sp.]|nr:TetR family transcriptional regulator C-terminal domain-containing protein [Rhizomicrobium sp.]
ESKEAFGLEILDIYFAESREIINDTLLNDAKPPLKRLRAWIDCNAARGEANGFRRGCLIGNFTAEAGTHGEAMRKRLNEIYAEIRAAIATCLKAAVKAGELPKGFDVVDTAGFIFSSMQGATLIAKAEGDDAAIGRFKKMLFGKVLR